MIFGFVNEKLEATVRLTVVDANGLSREFTAVIDTGYDGALTLPFNTIASLALPRGASREVTLGDSTRKVFDFYNAHVDWDGSRRKVRILCVEGDPLVGTLLLAGYKLDADFVPDGPVLINPIA